MVKKTATPKSQKATVKTMQCKQIAQPIGPYSCGKVISQPGQGTWGYSSGQIGMHPKTGDLDGKKPGVQARRALTNLRLLARSNGFDLEKHTVKTTVFLVDMADFAEINVEYAKFFKGKEVPPRSCVAVKQLPKNALFEIEAVFFKP